MASSSVTPDVWPGCHPPAAGPLHSQPNPSGGSQSQQPTSRPAFENLELGDRPSHPTPQTVLAHLKLLHAIHNLKMDIGHTDGLFGLWDWMAWRGALGGQHGKKQGAGNSSAASPLSMAALPPFPPSMGADPAAASPEMWDNIDVAKVRENLCRIREKRWAVYVARAVERYRKWLWSLKGDRLTTGDMQPGTRYIGFAAGGELERLRWRADMLMPLGKKSYPRLMRRFPNTDLLSKMS
jgi:hypothetical protein